MGEMSHPPSLPQKKNDISIEWVGGQKQEVQVGGIPPPNFPPKNIPFGNSQII